MKLNFIKYIPLLGLLPLAACDDYLDKTPDNRVIISTSEQMRQLMINAYSTTNYTPICELGTDNIIDNNSPDDTGNRYNLTYDSPADLEAYSWEDIVSDIQEDSPSYVWSDCYHAIAVCNNVLDAAERFEAEGRGDEVSAIKGEALISRAYHHFILANIFALHYAGPELSKQIPSIPYMYEIEDKVMVDYPREDLASVYSKIEADIEAGLPLINDAIYDVPKYHFNRKAANAFAARFYLYKRDYEKADYHATQALGGATGNPAGMMRTIWSKTFTTSDAQVYAYCSAEEQSNLLLLPTVSTWHRKRGQRFSINRDAANATIYGSGPTWSRYSFHPCYSGKLYLRGSQDYGLFTLKAGEIFEYTDKVAGIGYCHIIRSEFTAEEAILTRAEARLYMAAAGVASRSGQVYTIDDAIADLSIWDKSRQNIPVPMTFPELTKELIINFYQTRDPGYGIVKPLHIDEVNPSDTYALTPAIEPFIQCALHFRRIETIEDGLRWFDIKRYGIEIEHKIGKDRVETLTLNDPRRALQIPTDVLSAGFEPNIRVIPLPEGSTTLAPVKPILK